MYSQAIILRVDRYSAGRHIAFDKLYLFRQRDEKLVPRVFPSCLVLPLDENLAAAIGCIVSLRAGLVGLNIYHFRRKPGKSDVTLITDGAHKFMEDTLRNNRTGVERYIGVVPMLYTTRQLYETQSDGDVHPQYIAATPNVGATKRMTRRRKKKRVLVDRSAAHRELLEKCAVLSSAAYLLMNGARLGVLCQYCPNSMHMLAGECYYGSPDCYKHLLGVHPTVWQEACAQWGDMRNTNLRAEEDGDGL